MSVLGDVLFFGVLVFCFAVLSVVGIDEERREHCLPRGYINDTGLVVRGLIADALCGADQATIQGAYECRPPLQSQKY